MKIYARDVSVTRDNPRGHWTCATIHNGCRVFKRYIGYTKRAALRDFLREVNKGGAQ